MFFSVLCLLCLCARLFISLGSRLWCLTVSLVCHFPIGILGQVWYLIVSILDLCNLTYFYIGEAIGPPFEKVEPPPANLSPPLENV